jgi:signal transduction histidine kinase
MSRKVRTLADQLSQVSQDGTELSVTDDEPAFLNLRRAILQMRDRLNLYHKSNTELAAKAAVADVARQVAHDIRSPLTAIEMVVRGLSEIPDEKRNLLNNAANRINGIANDLLKNYKGTRTIEESSAGSPIEARNHAALNLTNIRIAELLKDIGAEKAAFIESQSRATFKIDISSPLDAVCEIDEKELGRAISNLINNAVEALDGREDGEVTLALRPSGKKEVAIIISDNGTGIPEDILARLGKERISAGKYGTDSGSGIGVFHAARCVEAIGGKFVIQSKIGLGTMITIRLPRADSPLTETTINESDNRGHE